MWHVSLYPFWIVYCLDRYKTQRMCDEAVDDSLTALKLIPDCFVTSKMIRKLYTALYADGGLLPFDEDSGDVTFCSNKMGILSIILNINLENNLMKMILILLFLSDFCLGIVNLKNAKHLKKS